MWGAAGVVGYTVIVLRVIGADRVTASHSGFTARDFADALLPVAAIAWLAVCAIFASHAERRPVVTRMVLIVLVIALVWGVLALFIRPIGAPLTALMTLLVSLNLLAAWLLARGRPSTLWLHAVLGAVAITVIEVLLYYLWIPSGTNTAVIALNYFIYWVPPVLIAPASVTR